MPSIQESVQKHQELLSEGKGTPVQSVPENSPILPEPASIGQLGPSRGSFVPGQVLDTDIAKQNIIGTPERSRMFPIPSNNGNNNAGIQQALKSIVKASETSVAQTVANFKNTPVATTDPSTGSLTQTTIGQSTPLPFAPPERRIPLDNIADGVLRVGLATTHAAGNVAYNFQGAWSNVTNYVIGDEVSVNGSYWIALAANTNSQPSLTNANWQSVGLNTLASTDQTAKTASIALTTLFTTPVAGFYLVAINLFDRATASGSSTLNALISWTQGGTSGLQQQTATITSSTLGAIGGSSAFLIFADASTAVKYSTTLTGTPTGGYDVHLRVLGPF